MFRILIQIVIHLPGSDLLQLYTLRSGNCSCAARAGIDHGHLAEELIFLQLCQLQFILLAVSENNIYAPVQDLEKALTCISLPEDHLSALECLHHHLLLPPF